MTSNPYTPDEAELRDSYAGVMDEYVGQDYDQAKADAERGIAKIKADVLRLFADELEANLTITSGSDDALTIGVLRERADEIEEEA